jgi:hypothetical protein
MQRLCEYGGAEGTQAILKYIFFVYNFSLFFVFFPLLLYLGLMSWAFRAVLIRWHLLYSGSLATSYKCNVS